MTEPLLSAAMIARNEERHLPACLESIRPVVDEIVLVDTGSTDGTVSIARSFGARVEVQAWHDDFATPRNRALDLARGRWILYIDADERLRPIDPDAVRAALKGAEEIALRVRFRPMVTSTPYWEYRLWRSDPRIRFIGRMHEKVVTRIWEVSQADGLMIGDSELYLEHVGYEGDQTHKHRRNLPVLQAQLAVDPIDAYSWHHLAVVLEGLGDQDQSDAALQRGLALARETGAVPGVLAFLKQIERARERGEDTGELLREALAHHPDSVALAWLQVIAAIDAGQYEVALRKLELFDVDPDMPVEDTTSYAAEMFGARAAEARAACLFKLGRYGEAAAAYAVAQELEPDEPAHGFKRAIAEHRAAASENGHGVSGPQAEGMNWRARELLHGLALDIGGVSVGVSVTDAMRAAAVRELLGRTLPSGRDPEVRLTFNGHPAPVPARPPDDSAGPLRLWHDDGALSLAYDPFVRGRVVGDCGSIGGETQHLEMIFRIVAPFMLASLLAPRGRFLLHAGAIQMEGRGVLILGDTGTGKSTLVLGAIEAGWQPLADDLVALRASERGPMVCGLPKRLAVPSEVLQADRNAPTGAHPSRDRVEVAVQKWDRDWHPVSMIVVAAHGTSEEAALEPIERPELLGLLLHAMLSQQPASIRGYMPVAAALSCVPGYRLLHAVSPQLRARHAIEAIAAARPR